VRNGQGTGLGMVWDYGLGKAFRQVERCPEAGKCLGCAFGAILPSIQQTEGLCGSSSLREQEPKWA
jgi:hypothetical protein